MKSALRTCLIGSFIAVFGSAYAWIDTGHMVIAAIAQSNLKPNIRAEADRLLRTTGTGTMADFIETSSWADETRTKENGPWHYEDHHFRNDGKRVTNGPEAENAVWAINKFTKILADKKQPDAVRAEALRFVIHFVADIHQPLHATALDSDQHPQGDRGGNDYHIETPRSFSNMDRGPRNLHFLWDMGCGLFMPDPSLRTPEGQAHVHDLAAYLVRQFPKKKLKGVGDKNPEHWAQESFAVCKTLVYSTPENAEPSSEYLDAGRKAASQRAAYAGYRLADVLNRALK